MRAALRARCSPRALRLPCAGLRGCVPSRCFAPWFFSVRAPCFVIVALGRVGYRGGIGAALSGPGRGGEALESFERSVAVASRMQSPREVSVRREAKQRRRRTGSALGSWCRPRRDYGDVVVSTRLVRLPNQCFGGGALRRQRLPIGSFGCGDALEPFLEHLDERIHRRGAGGAPSASPPMPSATSANALAPAFVAASPRSVSKRATSWLSRRRPVSVSANPSAAHRFR